jgi:hypothetical protein
VANKKQLNVEFDNYGAEKELVLRAVDPHTGKDQFGCFVLDAAKNKSNMWEVERLIDVPRVGVKMLSSTLLLCFMAYLMSAL